MMRAFAAHRFDLLQDDGKRIVERRHEHAAHHVDDADRAAVARFDHARAAARRAGGVVGRTQQAALGRDVVHRFLLVPDVIARRHHVHAVLEQRIADVLGDAEAGGRVLGVGDHEVDAVVIDEPLQPLAQELAAGPADDVADEEQPHAAGASGRGDGHAVGAAAALEQLGQDHRELARRAAWPAPARRRRRRSGARRGRSARNRAPPGDRRHPAASGSGAFSPATMTTPFRNSTRSAARRHAAGVHDQLDGRVGLEDVHEGPALAGVGAGVGAERAGQVVEKLANVVAQLARFARRKQREMGHRGPIMARSSASRQRLKI